MEAKEYIQNWIKTTGLELGITSAKYEFQEFDETHFLQIIPKEIVDEDSYNVVLSEFIIEFENTFVGEMLCLIGDTSLTKLENAVELCSQAPISLKPLDIYTLKETARLGLYPTNFTTPKIDTNLERLFNKNILEQQQKSVSIGIEQSFAMAA